MPAGVAVADAANASVVVDSHEASASKGLPIADHQGQSGVRGPVWLDSAVRLEASLRLGVAVRWEMKVVPIRCLAACNSVPGFFHHQRSTDTSK